MSHRSTLTRLGAVAGLVVSACAVAVLTATPANAAVINATTAAAAGTVAASATATCPAGQFLSGAAGSVVGGAGDETMTDVIPNLATQSVTVWGHTNPGAVAPGAYTVVAQAICVPGNAPPNYVLITSASANNTDPIKDQVAVCPAGTNLLGTGAELLNADGNAFYRRIEPDPALTQVSVTAGAAGGFAGPWQLLAFAICATPAVAGNLVTATGPFNSNDPKAQPSGACPMGALTTGVGGGFSLSAISNVMLIRVTANAAQNQAVSGAIEDGTYLPPWALTAYNICWG